ncbi:sulfotransferase domain-containing protein [Lapillicoccus sp.]|uniref:sulfotransferase domain-containing protein n=1 Tax=Lapillicoccus sp. TaxID=1909287 RepID=UPI0032638166
MSRIPNFLHLGPGKSGSTWLHETLSLHPQAYLSEAKDLYYFSRFYDRGTQWYLAQFAGAGDQPVVGEVCPDYLAEPLAPQRVHDTLGPDVRLMVSLRDPVDRAFSSYLYAAKHGAAAPTFRETAMARPELIDEGRYGTQLLAFARLYPAAQIHVSVFDDLQASPQNYLDEVTSWLEIDRFEIPAAQLEATLPASKARFVPVARVAQVGADWVRKHDGARVIGRVKRSSLVQRVLYTPLGDARPTITEDDAAWVRENLAGEVDTVEREFGLDLTSRWGWT